MASRRATQAAGALAVATLALSACSGGSDGGGATTRPTDTAAEASRTTDAATGATVDDTAGSTSGAGAPGDRTAPPGNGGLDLGDLAEELDGRALDDVDLSALSLSALGELLTGPGLEQRIEDSADVDVEITQDGFFVDAERATFTVDEDGNFTITVGTGGAGSASTDDRAVENSAVENKTDGATITGNLDLGG